MTDEEPIPFMLNEAPTPEEAGDNTPSFDQCLAHTQNWEEDCEYCLAEFQEGSAYLDGLLAQNTATRQKLTQRNGNTDPLNDIALLGMRLDMLMNMVLNNKGRMIYEINFHKSLIDILASIEGELTKSKLLGGINGMVPGKPNRQERRRNR